MEKLNPKQLIFRELAEIKRELNLSEPFSNNQRSRISEHGYRIAKTIEPSDWPEESSEAAKFLASEFGWYITRIETEQNNLLNEVLSAQITKLYEVSATLERISTEYDKQSETIESVIDFLIQSQRADFYG